jgi:hypothetical protein
MAERELHAVDARAENFRDLDEVRPERRDGDGAVAGPDQRLRDEHERGHSGIGHRDPVDLASIGADA